MITSISKKLASYLSRKNIIDKDKKKKFISMAMKC